MSPYIALSFFSVLCVGIYSIYHKNNFTLRTDIVLSLPLVVGSTLLAGFRFQTGGDWPLYEMWFDSFDIDELLLSGVEPVWFLFSIAIRYIGLGFNGLLFVTALISNTLMLYAFFEITKSRKLAIIGFSFYCLIAFYSTQMFYIRAGLATAFLILAVSSLEVKNFNRFIVLLLIAASTHVAASLAFLVFLYVRYFLRWPVLLIPALVVLHYLLIISFPAIAPNAYVSGDFSETREFGVKALFGVLVLILMILNIKAFSKEYGYTLPAFLVCGLVAPYLFDSYEVGGRVRLFFSPLDGVSLFLISKVYLNHLSGVFMAISSIIYFYFYWSNSYVQQLFVPYRQWLF